LRPTEVRSIGRKRIRRENDVRANLGKMKIQNWSNVSMDTETWKRTDEQAKTHKELQHKEKKIASIYRSGASELKHGP
jgi:hypothetical protein